MKKILSTILALSMLSATFTASVYAENENVTVTAADVTVRDGNNGVVHDGIVAFGTNVGNPVYGNAKIYKEDGIFGLSEGEYGIEMIAREQRKDQPYLAFNVGDIDASKDFYVTTNVYIGQQRENDYIRLGTALKDESGTEVKSGENFQGYKFFKGDGRVKLRTGDSGMSRQNASYKPENWVNYTIAGTNGVLAVYVDGVKFEGGWVSGISGGNKTCAYNGILKDVNPGIRIMTADSNVSGVPSFAVFKDVKLVYDTYNAADSSTKITSSKYTVTYDPVKLGSSDDNLALVKTNIIGVSSSETASEFLSNITAPAGGSVSLVKIADDTKRTIAVGGSEYMTSDMKLLVRAKDGSLKLYDIDVSLSNVLSLDTTGYTQGGYSIAEDTKTITLMPHTTVETVKNIVKANAGATYKIVNSKGKEVTSGAVTDSMKIVATKGGSSVEYSFNFKNTTALDVADRIKGVADGTKIYEADGMDPKYDYSGKGLLGINHSSAGYDQLQKANKSAGVSGTYTVTKTNMPGHTDENRINAWFFDAADDNGGWRMHSSNALGLHGYTKAEHGKKTIISFNVNLKAGSGFSFAPRHAYGTKPECTDVQYFNTSNTGTGDRITFKNNNEIYLGGQNRDYALSGGTGNYYEKIGTYNNDTEYEVVLIERREDSKIITEAVYVNGVNVIAGSPRTMVIKDGRDYFAIRDVTFQTVGDVYVGGLKIYMADEYSIPTPEEDDDGEEPGNPETPADANLAITALNDSIEIYTADALANNMATVKGYEGNVGDLKAAIDSDINTRLEVLEKTGTSVLSDNVALAAGMFVKVSDVNNPARYELYLLSDLLNMGTFAATEASNVVTATRTIKAYKTENKVVTLIIASYDNSGNLIDVDMDEKTVAGKGTYTFEASADKADEVKIMLWDGNMKPYYNAVSASDLLAQ